MIEFKPFPKMPRLRREMVITEKLDGTNAQIIIDDDGETLAAASRTRLITPSKDNYGFAKWVEANRDELLKLGPGHHYGEWWGQGIQRGYNMKEKRFSLFNVARWSDETTRPACCGVVPTLYRGLFSTDSVDQVVANLATLGSTAAPGFMNPEGVIVFHTALNSAFKRTIKDDDKPKGN